MINIESPQLGDILKRKRGEFMAIDLTVFLQNLWVFIGVPVIRSLGGWLTHALQDNKITWPEWRLLIETILRVGLMGIALWIGLEGLGIDVQAIVAAAVAYLLDLILRAIKYPEQRIVKRTEVTNISRIVKK